MEVLRARRFLPGLAQLPENMQGSAARVPCHLPRPRHSGSSTLALWADLRLEEINHLRLEIGELTMQLQSAPSPEEFVQMQGNIQKQAASLRQMREVEDRSAVGTPPRVRPCSPQCEVHSP